MASQDHQSSNTNNNSSDADTLPGDMGSNYEANRETVRNSNPRGLAHIHSGVDVSQAEEDFAELNRRLSGISQHSRRLSRQESGKSGKQPAAGDVEKTTGSEESDETWDLETTLRGNRNADYEAGIKPKHIGTLYKYPYVLCYYCLRCIEFCRFHC